MTRILNIVNVLMALILALGLTGPGSARSVGDDIIVQAKPPAADKPMIQPVKKTTANLLIVHVHADWCPACKNIAPAWDRIEQDYAKKARFVTLDVTTRQTASQAQQLADRLGISDFYDQYRARTSTVAILSADTGQVLKTFYNQSSYDAYANAIDHHLKGGP